MSEKIPYTQVARRITSDIEYIMEEAYLQGKHSAEQDIARAAYDEAYQKGYDEAMLIYQNPNAESDYQRGLDDAWEAARYLFSEMSNTEINLVFPHEWNNGGFKALMALDPKDAIDRINAFERKQKPDEIKVGDEVEAYSGRAIVFGTFTDTKGEKFCRYWYPSDDSFNKDKTENLKKTGRHFPQVEKLIEAMKGEQRDCHTCKHQVASSIECVDCRGFGKWEPKEGAE